MQEKTLYPQQIKRNFL